jgi:hypothetical protein
MDIHRTQLPAQLAWAVTVNKAQGKTIERALLDLSKPYWQHGSGFVAPSRTATGPHRPASGVPTVLLPRACRK